MKKFITLGFLFFGVFVLAGCGQQENIDSQVTTSISEEDQLVEQTIDGTYIQQPEINCIKDQNCCLVNSDCKYAWVTGSCNTSEYVAKKQKEAQARGIEIGEAMPRENVICTCENYKCITHN